MSAPQRGERRSADERAEARALGVDRYGRPTPRSLGLNPREIARTHEVSMPVARRLSAGLYAAAIERGARGAAPTPEASPAAETVSPGGRS